MENFGDQAEPFPYAGRRRRVCVRCVGVGAFGRRAFSAPARGAPGHGSRGPVRDWFVVSDVRPSSQSSISVVVVSKERVERYFIKFPSVDKTVFQC